MDLRRGQGKPLQSWRVQTQGSTAAQLLWFWYSPRSWSELRRWRYSLKPEFKQEWPWYFKPIPCISHVAMLTTNLNGKYHHFLLLFYEILLNAKGKEALEADLFLCASWQRASCKASCSSAPFHHVSAHGYRLSRPSVTELWDSILVLCSLETELPCLLIGSLEPSFSRELLNSISSVSPTVKPRDRESVL